MRLKYAFNLAVVGLVGSLAVATAETSTSAWPRGRTVELRGFRATISQPVLVARRHGYLWFPTVAKLANGHLLALMSDYQDDHVKRATAQAAWSGDDGRTW